MNYYLKDIAKIVSGSLILQGEENRMQNIIIDSRKISFSKNSIFIAFITKNNDGHNYIQDAYDHGVRNFIVSKKVDFSLFKDANFVYVANALSALQTLAKHHRKQFEIPVIAITGSNGKTILKEWLSKSLANKITVIQSPNSYNSQIGVALSILKINSNHKLAIIEAGISETNEMETLEKMIMPTVGVITNIGDAHSEGFSDLSHKLSEKIKLFKHCKTVFFNGNSRDISDHLNSLENIKLFSWGKDKNNDISILKIDKNKHKSSVTIEFKNEQTTLIIPFNSPEFIDLSMLLVSILFHFEWTPDEINNALQNIDLLPNRLQIREGLNGCLLINDSYSTDVASLQLALEYQQQHKKQLSTALIISDFDQQIDKNETYVKVNKLIEDKQIKHVYLIGIDKKYHHLFKIKNQIFFENTAAFKNEIKSDEFQNQCVLIKGARKHKLEQIFEDLSAYVHLTTLETDFTSLENNLNIYKSYLNPSTKMMAVIKADAYGSGSIQIADFLEKKGVDYLSVAIIDEAIKIRNSGCQLPILIFNVQHTNFKNLWQYNLEPEVYSQQLLKELLNYSKSENQPLNIHLKIDSGMHRLGFEENEIESVCQLLKGQNNLVVKSIFSHLSASENAIHDDFTHKQIETFNAIYKKISRQLGIKPLQHILNTGGIIRFPNHQYDMVRIGLGLYGIDETKNIGQNLEKVHSLKARILQIKKLKKGESTGYSRSGLAQKDMVIAIVSIGYADGLLRICGNGKYSVLINGSLCSTFGNICMDVMMVDVTHVPNITAGSEVEIFGKNLPIEDLAKSCQTISYEVISRIAPRVKKIYTYG
ncbi:MAG: bifunctional UDP-N-acetylmuramoyl-tripeptide:D-alanyl-D-alanine ligase/alanine racemase [Bacteroidia bacterium]|nr:bifunctional UDP-N-acetylmuramoyl-tripeptide:D-alanyl-D-alanine ligase/alanine racemase [Bacteroidia bacterium]